MKNYFCLLLFALTVIKKLEAGTLKQLPDLLTESAILQSQYFPSVVDLNDKTENYSDEYIESALSYARLTYITQFPTAATSFNISDQCKEDSQTYFRSYKAQKNWALRSNQLNFIFCNEK